MQLLVHTLQRFSGCLTRIHLKFWHMHTDAGVCSTSMCLHHLHLGVLPIGTHDINLMMSTQYSGLDFKYKACFNRPYLHTCTNFLNRSWSSNLKTSVYEKKAAGEEPGNEAMLYQTLSFWVGSLVPRLHCRTALLYLSDKTLTDSTELFPHHTSWCMGVAKRVSGGLDNPPSYTSASPGTAGLLCMLNSCYAF